MQIAVVDDARFDGHRAAELHPERPERLGAARAGLESVLPPDERLDIAARPASNEELVRVHAPEYVEHLRTALQKGWGHLDADTFFCPDSAKAAWLAAGGTAELVHAILNGRAQRGIALLRPPGHHATSTRAMGFCLLNNIAIGAAAALDRGAGRVAIVDWDVHHGNGTQEIFYSDRRVLFVSTHQSPLYPGTGRPDEIGRAEGEGYTVNIPMPPGAGPDAYGEAFRTIIVPVLKAFRADIVLVSSGLDAHRRDPLAQLELDSGCFGAMTTALVRHVDELGHGRLALVLEGGYDLDAIEESFAEIASALQGYARELPKGPVGHRELAALSRVKNALEKHWEL